MKKYKIGFICVHNSCRSIMAEGIAKKKYSDIFDVYSAGTENNDKVNPIALEVLNEKYNIVDDFNSKLITILPELDIVITMGCNVNCPYVKSKYRDDFGIDDPSGKGKEEYIKVADEIERKIDNLATKIKKKEIIIQ